MRLSKLLCAVALAGCSGLAAAQPSYSHFELGYIADADFDKLDQGDGVDLRLRFKLGESFFFHGHVADAEGDDSGAQIDTFGLALGFQWVWLEKLGLYATYGFEDLELSDVVLTGLAPDFDDKGQGFELGARYPLLEGKLELGFEVDYDTYDHAEARFYELAGVYALTPSFSAVVT
ncbi:MAG: outer membrane beta-barrel protein, partial [Burkholderiales bacterium]